MSVGFPLLFRNPAGTVPVVPTPLGAPRAAWRFIVTDAAGINVGEPSATGRTVTVGVSGVESAGFQLRAEDALWNLIAAGEANLKVFNSAGGLAMYGPVISDEEVGSGQGATVQCTAAGQAWWFGKRFTAKDPTGVGNQYVATDPATIIATDLSVLNAEQPTGVTLGTVGTFPTQTVAYLWKRFSDELSELGATEGAYEWNVTYTDGQPPTCRLNLVPQLGTDRSLDVFFEYGYGTLHNCSGYRRSRSIANLATHVWANGNGTTANVVAYDTSFEQFSRAEDVISYGDITDTGLLDALAIANVAVRKTPQILVDLTPFPATAPKFGVDWFIGDIVAARVVVNNQVRVSGKARIWSAQISIDELGNETATLTLQPNA